MCTLHYSGAIGNRVCVAHRYDLTWTSSDPAVIDPQLQEPDRETALADRLVARTQDLSDRVVAAFADAQRHARPSDGVDEAGRRRDLVRAVGTLFDCLRKVTHQAAEDAATITAIVVPANESPRKERQEVLAGLERMAWAAGVRSPFDGDEQVRGRIEEVIALRHSVVHADHHEVSDREAALVAAVVQEVRVAFAQIATVYGELFYRRAGEHFKEAWEAGNAEQRRLLFMFWATEYARMNGSAFLNLAEDRTRRAAESFLSGMVGKVVRIEVTETPILSVWERVRLGLRRWLTRP